MLTSLELIGVTRVVGFVAAVVGEVVALVLLTVLSSMTGEFERTAVECGVDCGTTVVLLVSANDGAVVGRVVVSSDVFNVVVLVEPTA